MPVSETLPYDKRRVRIDGPDNAPLDMACVDHGAGEAIVFLHGNPTSSYLWRNVLPHLDGKGRLIAPDLLGMGDSDTLPESGPSRYRFVEHRACLDALFDALDLGSRVTLVVHDWGAALGFDWARRHPDRVRGIAYMEAMTGPMTWDDLPADARPVFEGFRSAQGEAMCLDQNMFVENVLPAMILRTLRDAEMDAYRRPFATPGESRRPTLTWPREIPFDGAPADTDAILRDSAAFMAESPVAKLRLLTDPGALMTGRNRARCDAWPNQRDVTVPGLHYAQEDAPDAIGTAIRDWLPG